MSLSFDTTRSQSEHKRPDPDVVISSITASTRQREGVLVHQWLCIFSLDYEMIAGFRTGFDTDGCVFQMAF